MQGLLDHPYFIQINEADISSVIDEFEKLQSPAFDDWFIVKLYGRLLNKNAFLLLADFNKSFKLIKIYIKQKTIWIQFCLDFFFYDFLPYLDWSFSCSSSSM